MSRFNESSTGTKTVNLAGGKAYTKSKELELVSILLTSFAKDEYYRSRTETFRRLTELIKECDKEFVAKAAIYARTKFGMRSITHVLAAELAKYASGTYWAKEFYSDIIYRPDDMMEIVSYLLNNGNKIPNAIKKGFALAFDRFDAYSLAKYKGDGKKVKLIDIVNLVHPIPTSKNAEALKSLVNGTLKSFDTWENELSAAGQGIKDENKKKELKRQVWIRLITERKLGYFALLRNLRNIIEQAPEAVQEACNMLTDENLISKSLVLPFRFTTAYNQIMNISNPNKSSKKVLKAISFALDKSMKNIPVFDGDTLVACDFSGSMGSGLTSMRGKATLFGIAFAKTSDSDFMIFGDRSEYINYNSLDTTATLMNYMNGLNTHSYLGGSPTGIGDVGHATNFPSIFRVANKEYDRIVIFTDEQGWVGRDTPVKAFHEYRKNYGVNPKVYMFDLAGYGTAQFPEDNVFCLAGFSEKVFDIMKLMEQDKKALINTINKINLIK